MNTDRIEWLRMMQSKFEAEIDELEQAIDYSLDKATKAGKESVYDRAEQLLDVSVNAKQLISALDMLSDINYKLQESGVEA